MSTMNALSNGEEIAVMVVVLEILLFFCLVYPMGRAKIDSKGINFRVLLLLLLLDDIDDLLVTFHNHFLKNN